eukprot:scaffold60977_cov41-Prasinocladus_malaysianus.AAC.1
MKERTQHDALRPKAKRFATVEEAADALTALQREPEGPEPASGPPGTEGGAADDGASESGESASGESEGSGQDVNMEEGEGEVAAEAIQEDNEPQAAAVAPSSQQLSFPFIWVSFSCRLFRGTTQPHRVVKHWDFVETHSLPMYALQFEEEAEEEEEDEEVTVLRPMVKQEADEDFEA